MTTDSIDYNSKPVTLLKDAVIEAISLVDKGANGHSFVLFKRAPHFVDESGQVNVEGPDTAHVSKETPLIKGGPSKDEWRVAYSVVAVPSEVDIQKDVWTEEEIRKAAHDFLRKNKPLINFMHKNLESVGDLVESAIALDDINIGDHTIKKGSWYIGVEPNSEVKKRIEAGEITGVSVQGAAKRIDASDSVIDTSGERPIMKGDVPAEMDEDESDKFDYRHIPLGAEGPGIKKLQKMLNVSPDGLYGEVTEDAFMRHLDEVHDELESEPTIENLKKCLQKCGAGPVEEPAAAQEPKDEAEVEKDAIEYDNGNPTGPDADGYDPAHGVSSQSAYGASEERIGSLSGNKGIVPTGKMLNPNATSEALRVALYQAYEQGDDDLIAHMKNVHHISSPGQVLTTPLSHEMLWYMYSQLVMDTKDAEESEMNRAEAVKRAEVTSQPAHTPKENLPEGSGVSISKGMYLGESLCKSCQSLTKRCGDHQASVPMAKGCPDCTGVEKVCKAHQANLVGMDYKMMSDEQKNAYLYGDVKKGAMFDHREHPLAVFRDKDGNEVRSGDIVRTKGGQVVEVSSIDMVGREGVLVRVYHVDKDGKEVVKEHKPESLVAVIRNDAIEKAASSLGGSMGGQDPRKHGKIRFIVRSFGKWAGGKHRICVARMKAEHPEVFKGNEDAGCAWLKDQWAGTTKWRSGRKEGMVKGSSAFANIYNSQILSKGADMSDDQIHSMYTAMCADMGLDASEIEKKMDEGFDGYLNKLLGEPEGHMNEMTEEQKGLVAKFMDLLRGEKSEVDKGEEMKPVSEEDVDEAVDALQLALMDAVSVEDPQERAADLKQILEEFSGWVEESLLHGKAAPKSAQPEDDMKDEGEKPEADMEKMMGATVESSDGTKWIVIGEEGDKLRVKSGDKVAMVPKAAVAVVKEPMGKMDNEKSKDMKMEEESLAALMPKKRKNNLPQKTNSEEIMSKSTEETRERLVAEAGAFMDDLVDDTTVTNEAELEKTEEGGDVEATPELSLTDVALFADKLADRLDVIESSTASLSKGLGDKLDTVTELAKSLDISDRLSALEEAIEGLKSESTEQVQEVAKRVNDLEQQPGHATNVPDTGETTPVVKAAPIPFMRGGASLF